MVKPTIFVQPPWAEPTIRMFQQYGYPVTDVMEQADVVAFNGGEDIHPKLYGQTIIPHASVEWLDEARDELEVTAYKKATELGKFKFGICRGGQLLNVMAGGTLIQDVSNHERDHAMIDVATGDTIWTSSVHHQMFIPASGGEVLAFATEADRKLAFFPELVLNGHKQYFTWYRDSLDVPGYSQDPEVVWYKDSRDLCIQGHPEYPGYGQFTEYCLNTMERLL